MALIGIFCVAFRTPTRFWAGASLALMLTLILTGVLVSIHRTGGTRAFAVGFVLFSAGYLVGLALLNSRFGFDTPTSSFGDWLSDRIHPPGTMNKSPGGPPKPMPYNIWTFRDIIRCAMACLFGIAGGVISQLLFATRHDQASKRDSC